MPLAGAKTYIVAALMGLAAIAFALGWIDRSTFEALMGLLNAGGLAALRQGVTQETAALPKAGEPPAVVVLTPPPAPPSVSHGGN
jgi:hypothetical protein